MTKGKGDIITGAIANPGLVRAAVFVIAFLGIFTLARMQKDEFPSFTIREGIVAGVYPGADAETVERELTKPLEDIIFAMSEVNRNNTRSFSKEGMSYIYVALENSVKDKDAFWSKLRHRLNESTTLSLPPGVLAVAVIDDFGNTSTLLIAMESRDKSYRELQDYAETLCSRLRSLKRTSAVKILGERTEEIAVKLDPERASLYGVTPTTLMAQYASSDITTTAGSFEHRGHKYPFHLDRIHTWEEEIASQVVCVTPGGESVRLSDIATVERRYQKANKVVNYDTDNALIISVEMRKGNNIVSYGKEVNEVLDSFEEELPSSVRLHRITDQPKVVSESVYSFLRDLVISMLVVIAVMMLLFPIRTAIVASSSLPVCTAAAIASMYFFGIELNTVTLAALIVVLGMVVDDSIINIDGYVDNLEKGMEPFDSAVTAARTLFMPMFIATTAICAMFFPIKVLITGPLGDFVQLFPWTILFAMAWSLIYAMLVIPGMEIRFIKSQPKDNAFTRVQRRFFTKLQALYDSLQALCFRHPFKTIAVGLGSIALGILMFLQLNVQMMPMAERDLFAIEMRLGEGSTVEETTAAADSLQKMLLKDPRITAVSAFVGETAPRFHVTYAPSMPSSNLAQLIVSTTSIEATEELLPLVDSLYSYHFNNAHVRVRQMDYQACACPIEVFVLGDDLQQTAPVARKIRDYMKTMEGDRLRWVHSSDDDVTSSIRISPKSEQCAALGISPLALSLTLHGDSSPITLTGIQDGYKSIPVQLYLDYGEQNSFDNISDRLVATAFPGVSVPLREVADISPSWERSCVERRYGSRCISVSADMKFWESQIRASKQIRKFVDEEILPTLPEGVSIKYGGLDTLNSGVIPEIGTSFVVAVLILLLFLVLYFKKISISLLTLAASMLCFFGAFLGEWLFNLDFGMTSVLGVVSLIGIIVRNGIVMYEYAEELRCKQGLSAREAAMKAGSRRMRPIFLTSATTALGVLPMIISHNPLWMPMGVVICFGVVLSLIIVLSVMPVIYWRVYK